MTPSTKAMAFCSSALRRRERLREASPHRVAAGGAAQRALDGAGAPVPLHDPPVELGEGQRGDPHERLARAREQGRERRDRGRLARTARARGRPRARRAGSRAARPAAGHRAGVVAPPEHVDGREDAEEARARHRREQRLDGRARRRSGRAPRRPRPPRCRPGPARGAASSVTARGSRRRPRICAASERTAGLGVSRQRADRGRGDRRRSPRARPPRRRAASRRRAACGAPRTAAARPGPPPRASAAITRASHGPARVGEHLDELVDALGRALAASRVDRRRAALLGRRHARRRTGSLMTRSGLSRSALGARGARPGRARRSRPARGGRRRASPLRPLAPRLGAARRPPPARRSVRGRAPRAARGASRCWRDRLATSRSRAVSRAVAAARLATASACSATARAVPFAMRRTSSALARERRRGACPARRWRR